VYDAFDIEHVITVGAINKIMKGRNILREHLLSSIFQVLAFEIVDEIFKIIYNRTWVLMG
jgi:hypothetical protein